MTEIYATIGRGDTRNGLFTLLAEPLVVFGPRRSDAFVSRADALVALETIIDPKAKKKTPLRSGPLDVVASEGGRSAWAFDVVNTGAGEPLAMLAILSNEGDIWVADAAALARMPSGAVVKADAARDAIVPPGFGGKNKIDPNARAAVDRFQKGLLDQQIWGDDLMSSSETLVVGPSAGEIVRGKAEMKKLWKKRVDTNVRLATTGETTALVTSDGQLAWVTAPVTRVGDGQDTLPLRAFAIFERAGDGWRMVALSESLAVDAPGSGTAFKKILPPKPIPKVVEPPPDKTAAKDKKGKKVKKGATGKPVDETPPPKKKTKKTSSDDEDETPKKKRAFSKSLADDETEAKRKSSDDEDAPKKKSKKKSTDDEDSPKKVAKKSADEDETPKKKKKKLSDDEDETPKKTKKKSSEDEDDAPKKTTKKKKAADDEEDQPKKKAKKSSDDDIKIEDD